MDNSEEKFSNLNSDSENQLASSRIAKILHINRNKLWIDSKSWSRYPSVASKEIVDGWMSKNVKEKRQKQYV